MIEQSECELAREGRRVLMEEADALRHAAAILDEPAWSEAVRLLLTARGRVVVSGMGKSGTVGRKISGTLSSTGTPALFLHPAEALHGDLGALTAEDVMLALSYSGETDELLAMLPGVKALDVPIIGLTASPGSRLGKACAVVIDVAVDKEACPMNLAPTTSTTVMLALGDALAVTVMGARDFGASDYARRHPAGSLGRRLTLHVRDVMRTGDEVAIVPAQTTMHDTMFAITKAHAGAAIVTGDDGRVCGLITDGDIRRHLLEDRNLLDRPASSVMNTKLGLIPPDMLAVEGLQKLGEFHPLSGHKVGEAPVVDADGRPVGMLTLKDLVKAGLD
jgi:arabinose-5-phosphate isomerase